MDHGTIRPVDALTISVQRQEEIVIIPSPIGLRSLVVTVIHLATMMVMILAMGSPIEIMEVRRVHRVLGIETWWSDATVGGGTGLGVEIPNSYSGYGQSSTEYRDVWIR